MKIRLLLGLLFAGLLGPSGFAARSASFYIATSGHDGWSGRLPAANANRTDGPFASLERARDAVRMAKSDGLAGPLEVILRGGVYTLDRTLLLTPEDSGTKRFPITWRAAEGERVLLRGARRITGWKPWQRGIFVADLKTQGPAGVSFHQLFHRSGAAGGSFARRQIMARFPNFDPQHPRTGGFVYVAEQAKRPNENLIYEAGALPFDRWRDIRQAEVVATYSHGWMGAITPILGVDTATRTIKVRRVRGTFLKLNRFFIQNTLEALDSPGEWHLDRDESRLYFLPPDGEEPNQSETLAPVLDHLIEARGTIPYSFDYLNVAFHKAREESPLPADAPPLKPVEHLVFEGLGLECAEQDGIRIVGGRDCRVVRCRIANVGGIGVNLGGVADSFAEVGNPRRTPAAGRATGGAGGGGQILLFNDPCLDCRVTGCDVWATGMEGVMLLGDRNTAENNHVRDAGLYAKDAPCINLLGDANVARRNTLHDCPRCAIFIKGVNNLVELNDVHHTNLETCDMGGIRMVQRNRQLKGNRIRFNRVMDTVGYGYAYKQATHYESPYFTWGIYLDDYTCGTEVFGNIVSRAGRGGVMIHGGGDNLIANNIILNAGSYQVEFAPMEETRPPRDGVYAGNRVERNILVCTAPGAVPYRFTRVPRDPPAFRNNLLWSGANDLVFITSGMTGVKGFGSWAVGADDEGSIVADPQLIAAATGDLLPAPGSPSWQLGFQPIPAEQIGCYTDEARASWPLEPNRGRFRESPVLHAVAGYDPKATRPPVVQLVGPVSEDFEDDPAGQRPLRGDIMAPGPAEMTVTRETAARGRQSLKIVDAPNLQPSWAPRIYYPLHFRSGVVRVALDLRLDGAHPPALYLDPRHYGADGRDYASGPMLTVRPNGDLLAGGKALARLPHDQWVHLEMRVPLGGGIESQLTITAPGVAPRTVQAPHARVSFRQLDRLVISSLSDAHAVFHIDNLVIETAEK